MFIPIVHFCLTNKPDIEYSKKLTSNLFAHNRLVFINSTRVLSIGVVPVFFFSILPHWLNPAVAE